MKTKVLVTGANGQLGQTIKNLYRSNCENIDFIFLDKKDLNIANETEVKSYFSENTLHYCINCAAYTNVEQAEKTPEIAYKMNAEAVRYLANACRENQVVLIHISTDYVFDGANQDSYSVTDTPNPINEYGKSKLLGEQYIQDILESYFIIRTSWLYSKEYGANFYKSVLEKAKRGDILKITEDQTGCPTNADNLSKYIFKLIHKNNTNFGIHHFCDSKIMTWYDFAKEILLEHDLLTQENLVKVANYSTFAARPKRSVLQLNNK